MNYDRSELLGFLKDHYDLEELRTLCFELYVPFDDLAGTTRESKARELLTYCERHDLIGTLLGLLAADHPADYRERFGRKPRGPSSVAHYKRRAGQVFISHAHQDSEVAHVLADWLRQQGFSVWIAPDSIRPGEQWVEAINRGLSTSEIFLLLLTPAAVASRWVRFETNIAISQERQDRMAIIPLAAAECDPPVTWQAYQAVPFSLGDESALAQLADRLAQQSGETNGERPAPSAVERPPAGSTLTDWQADQIQVLAWSVGLELGREDGRNLYQPVYALLNSHFRVTGFREIPAARYHEARKFLANWLQQLVQANTKDETT